VVARPALGFGAADGAAAAVQPLGEARRGRGKPRGSDSPALRAPGVPWARPVGGHADVGWIFLART